MMAFSSSPDSAPLRIILIDRDPIFRVGLRAWLMQYPEFQVVEDIDDWAIAHRRLQVRLAPEGIEPPEAILREPEGSPEEWSQDDGFDEWRDDGRPDPTATRSELPSSSSPIPPRPETGDTLVILGGALQGDITAYGDLIDLCQYLKQTHSAAKVLVVGQDAPTPIAAAHQAGADGYVSKAAGPDGIVNAIHTIIEGAFDWIPLLAKNSGNNDGSANDGSARGLGANGIDAAQIALDEDGSRTVRPSTTPAVRVGPFAQLRFRIRVTGLRQIDAQLARLHPYVDADSLASGQAIALLDRWVIAGRCRELRTARWIVATVLATPAIKYLDWTGVERSSPDPNPGLQRPDPVSPPFPLSSLDGSVLTPDGPPVPPNLPVESFLVRWQRRLGRWAQQPLYQVTDPSAPSNAAANGATPVSPSGLQVSSSQMPPMGTSAMTPPTPADDPTLSPVSVRATLFDALRDRLQSPLLNQTDHPLEIDILREEKRRELLVLILHKLLALLDDLRYSDVQPQQLIERRSQLFYDLWQSILTDYFGKYYVVQVDGLELEVVTILSQDARVVQQSIFDRIPFALDVLSHFLFQAPLEIDSVPYSLGTPEAFERAELLLDNFVIQLGNSVVQPLLNHLADVEIIKQNFYDRQLMSSRDIARFRNSLSWHYRRKQYVDEPTAIFESTYTLLALRGMGIKSVPIYASRRAELDRLAGLPLLVTLLLEVRDALSPRLRGAIAAVGSGVIYILTDVIGRAIGLIGRGILKGIGYAWQDPGDSRRGGKRS